MRCRVTRNTLLCAVLCSPCGSTKSCTVAISSLAALNSSFYSKLFTISFWSFCFSSLLAVVHLERALLLGRKLVRNSRNHLVHQVHAIRTLRSPFNNKKATNPKICTPRNPKTPYARTRNAPSLLHAHVQSILSFSLHTKTPRDSTSTSPIGWMYWTRLTAAAACCCIRLAAKPAMN